MVESAANVTERRLSSAAQPTWLQSNKQTTSAFELTAEEENSTTSEEIEQRSKVYKVDTFQSNQNVDNKLDSKSK